MSGDDFAAILDKHQARTATAEGQTPQPKTSSRKADRDERREAHDAATGKDAARQSDTPAAAGTDAPAPAVVPAAEEKATVTAPALPAVLETDVKPAVEQATTVENAPAAVPVAPVQAPVTTDKAEPVAAPKVAAPTEPAAPPAPADSRQPTADPKPADTKGPTASAPEPTPAQPEAKDAKPVSGKPEAPATPAEHRSPTAQSQRQAQPDTPGREHAPGQQPQQQATTATAPKPTQPTADSGQPTQTQPTQPPQPAAPATAPTAAARAAAPAAATPVRLSHAPEAVENTIRIAQARGVTHARLALRPAELGGIEIHLRSTADGLVARVTADGQAAAHVLQQAGDDLRRQLQSQGIDLQRLDIGVAGDPGHGRAGMDGAAHERQAEGQDGSARGSDERDADDGSEADTKARDTIELPDGVLVDVLA